MPPRGNLFQQMVYVGHLDERKRELKATWPDLLICQRYSLSEIGAAKGVKGCLSPLDIAIQQRRAVMHNKPELNEALKLKFFGKQVLVVIWGAWPTLQ